MTEPNKQTIQITPQMPGEEDSPLMDDEDDEPAEQEYIRQRKMAQ